MTILNVVFVRDHTMSMSSRANAAREDFNSQILQLKTAQRESDDLVINVGVVECRSMYGTNTMVDMTNVENISPMALYDTSASSTALYRAVNQAVLTAQTMVADSYLLVTLTDGQDNASTHRDLMDMQAYITQLQSTDKWTFAFRVPSENLKTNLSRYVPADNIQVWELSSAGLTKSAEHTSSSLRSFTANVASGAAYSTTKFYASADKISENTLKATLNDISSEIRIYPVGADAGSQIRAFVEKRIGKKMKLGSAFYQLMKTETVQSQKTIMIRDRLTYQVYHGNAARSLLGLPFGQSIKLVPGTNTKYDIFVQSTSVNRKLEKNTQLIYWENFDGMSSGAVTKPVQNPIVNMPVNTVLSSSQQNVLNQVLNSLVNSENVIQTPQTDLKSSVIPSRKVAAKKAIKPVKSAPQSKVRVRNRNTIQEQIRRFLIAEYGLIVKKVVNTAYLSDLGVITLMNAESIKNWQGKRYSFNKQFNVSVSNSDWMACQTVGDVISLVTN